MAGENPDGTLVGGVYGRTARLDPATPDMLRAKEQNELFLGDPDMDANVSVCAVAGGQPVGLCLAYRGTDPLEMEFGPVGVGSDVVDRHQEISLSMVRSAAGRAAELGVKLMQAEVDSDAHWGLYPFADLPGRVVESLVSLMYVPKWSLATGREEDRGGG